MIRKLIIILIISSIPVLSVNVYPQEEAAGEKKFSFTDIFTYEHPELKKNDELEQIKDWRWSIRGRIYIFPGNDNFSIKYYTFYVQKMNNTGNYRREFDTYTKKYFEVHPHVKKTDEIYYLQAVLSI